VRFPAETAQIYKNAVEHDGKYFPQNTQDYKLFRVTLTLVGKVTNLLLTLISLKMAERSDAKRAKRSFASNIKYLNFDAYVLFHNRLE
jgi:hypothetical protein